MAYSCDCSARALAPQRETSRKGPVVQARKGPVAQVRTYVRTSGLAQVATVLQQHRLHNNPS
jgi:hypothetical protein